MHSSFQLRPECLRAGRGGCIVDLLKCKEAGDTEEVSSSTAEEAKEIIKTMSLKGEGEKKTEAAPPVVEETENEKYKRARKLYSLRMENLIKARLNQSQGNSTIASNTTTSNVQTSKPAAAASSPDQGGLDVHPEPEQQPAPIQPRQQQVEPDHQRVPGVQGQDQTTNETRSLFYDIVIAVVIVIIALLLYRRLTLVSEITSSSPPAN